MRKEVISDQGLIDQYLSGNEDCLRMLINRHKSQIYTTIYFLVKDEYLAEDLFQETFLKIVNTLKEGRYQEQGKFLPWALRIARNLAIDHFRKTNKRPVVTDNEGTDILENLDVEEETNMEDDIVREQTQMQVRDLIQRLPENQKEVLVYRHYAGLSFKEIAELTNVSINTALGRMRYALNNLRKIMAKHQITS
jgi:RNA polymerase sigma factor (sigma-70 family)